MLNPMSPTFPLQVIGLSCGFVILLLVIIFYGLYRTAQKGRDEFAKAVPATATILQIGHSHTSRNYGDVLVHLTFEVAPASGRAYELKTEWSIEPAAVSKLKEGLVLNVKIDPKDSKKLYSTETWARALGQEPVDPED